MSSQAQYNTMRLQQSQRLCRQYFNVHINIRNILFHDISTGKDAYCLLFQDDRKHLYALCVSKNKQTFADVKKIITSMGLAAEQYYPPHNDAYYFERKGIRIFQQTYPGRAKLWNEQEKLFYSSLSSYKIALVKVSQVNGEIRRYTGSRSGWLKVFDYQYARIKVRYA